MSHLYRLFLMIGGLLLILTRGFSQEKRFITFYATTDGLVGHAFVSFTREDDNLQQTVVDGVWGLYPKEKVSGALSLVVGEVPGEIRDDFLTRPDVGLTVEVTEQEYQSAINIKERWKNSPYELTERDCLSFVIEIAQSIDNKITVPDRSFPDKPYDYINTLKLLNINRALCPAHKDIVDEYNREEPNFHMYTHVETICDTNEDSCCTERLVFDVMRSQGKNNAPGGGDAPIMDCGMIELPGFGSIVTKIGSSPYSITNYTKENHRLHKGKVVRYIVKTGTKINVYTIGIGNNKNLLYKYLNQNTLSVELVWGKVNRNLKEAVKAKLEAECQKKNSTLFLFDLSGSMNDHGGGAIPKVEQAKNASKETLDALKSNGQGIVNQVAAYGFAGYCVPDPTIEISPFDTDLDAVEQKIFQMRADGGTPLGNAIRAAECKMAAHLQREGQQKGRLIILSDGQGTCGSIRPNGVYNSAPLQRNRSVIVDASHCGGGVSPNASQVSYYTVGFNIPPGSPAERDLQYLSQISGGKYLNVQNQVQLARAFRKFNRVYQPKEYPALSDLPANSTTRFSAGVDEIKEEYYEKALERYTLFVQDHPDDCHGVYNLAIAQEANDYLKEAIDSYRKYLSLCPSTNDRTFVEKQIKFLEEEFREFVQFQRAVVKSDLDFLKIHFERIQHGQSVALAEEFKGFLQEKGNYYKELPRLIASNDRFLTDITEEIASSFEQCKLLIRRSPDSWDRDAIPLISMSYLNLQDLLDEM